MKSRKLFVAIIAILVFVFSIGSPANVFATDANNYRVDAHNARSYNSSFLLDFSQSSSWTLNFDNNVFGPYNHRYVTVSYTSCIPSRYTNAKVQVKLYIDSDDDGVYEECDPYGGYTFTVKVGEDLKITLPHGNEVKKYRLLFVNKTNTITSGAFTVKTSRN